MRSPIFIDIATRYEYDRQSGWARPRKARPKRLRLRASLSDTNNDHEIYWMMMAAV